jgi:HlyD family secretion protein
MTQLIRPERPGHKSLSSLRLHARLGYGLALVLLMSLFVWAWATNIAGAVIAHGFIVVSSNTKKIQHPSGGVVREILVRNGSVVERGDPLLMLDDTVLSANLSMIDKALTEMLVRKARLLAERDGSVNIEFTEVDMLAATAESAVRGEKILFQSRRTARDSLKAQLRQRISQVRDEIDGLLAQSGAKSKEIQLIATELEGARTLWNKTLMPITKFTALQREAVKLEGERGSLIAQIALAKGKVTEMELKILQIDQDLSEEVGKELREAEYRINELVERKVAAADQLRRTAIIAPQNGTVHELAVHTVGGVIAPADPIMLIVPTDAPLVAEIRIPPQEIDQLKLDQEALLRFTAFSQSTTPDCPGTLRNVSADVITDRQTGAMFYLARVEIDRAYRCLQGAALLPGMPVEVFLKTSDRSVGSYFIKPLRDQIERAFRDG